jgi:hypothetical protein
VQPFLFIETKWCSCDDPVTARYSPALARLADDGGESHFTHITPFAVWKDPGIPYWWTPTDRKQYPPVGCGALVDMTNNTGAHLSPASPSLNGTFSADITTDAVVEVLNAHPEDTPIFLYVAYHAVHTPLEVPEAYSKPYESRVDDRDRQILGECSSNRRARAISHTAAA